jgi:Domain of unknown function (DUF397)
MTHAADQDLMWRTSSFSGPTNGGCVAVAWPVPLVAVRDSKNPTGPGLAFPRADWGTFLRF